MNNVVRMKVIKSIAFLLPVAVFSFTCQQTFAQGQIGGVGNESNNSQLTTDVDRLTKLEERIEVLDSKSKDFWDKLQVWSSILTPLVVAVVGFYFSYSQTEKDLKVARIQKDKDREIATIQKERDQEIAEIEAKVKQSNLISVFMEPLLSASPEKRKLAITAISLALSEDVAQQLVSSAIGSEQNEKVITNAVQILGKTLNSYQVKCLRYMRDRKKFLFDRQSLSVERHKSDIRRLFSVGFIDNRPGKGSRTLFEQGADEQDINSHFCITDLGKQILDYLDSDVFKESVRDITLDLILIESGSFLMGSPGREGSVDEKPQHKVTVESFLMSRYQVTQAQWKAVAELPKIEQDLEVDPANLKGDNRPVEQVSWDEVMEFCKRLSAHTHREYRLPSEAEWEYACRAGTTTPFYFGKTLTSDMANFKTKQTMDVGFNTKQTMDVGCFPANAFGLYDMHGNVWEWCLDHWHESYDGAPTDGSAWIKGGDSTLRVLRGGSGIFNSDACRSAKRGKGARHLRSVSYGFRVVCASSWTL